jgi:hypothetical protein
MKAEGKICKCKTFSNDNGYCYRWKLDSAYFTIVSKSIFGERWKAIASLRSFAKRHNIQIRKVKTDNYHTRYFVV